MGFQVAKIAGTNKNTIYQRWPKKVLLVMAAMGPHVPELALETPLTANLRQDLIAALSALTPVFTVTTPANIQGIVTDGLVENGTATFLNAINDENLIQQQANYALNQLPNASKLSKRQRALPAILIINEILQTGTLAETTITQIVDDLLLPIYKTRAINQKASQLFFNS